jgi:hypothetical protein
VKKLKAMLILTVTVFGLAISLSISALSVSAIDTAPSEEGGHLWGYVCCGAACGEDECSGTGNYRCCKK